MWEFGEDWVGVRGSASGGGGKMGVWWRWYGWKGDREGLWAGGGTGGCRFVALVEVDVAEEVGEAWGGGGGGGSLVGEGGGGEGLNGNEEGGYVKEVGGLGPVGVRVGVGGE